LHNEFLQPIFRYTKLIIPSVLPISCAGRETVALPSTVCMKTFV